MSIFRKCPDCGAEPESFTTNTRNENGYTVRQYYCPDCGAGVGEIRSKGSLPIE